MSFSYANPISGPSAGGIGWFDFGTLSLAPGQSVTGLTGTLNDGTTVTFDLAASNLSGAPRAFAATTVPTYVGSQFGNSAYTSISGNVAIQTEFSFLPGSNQLVMSNIVVLDSLGNPVPNYTAIVVDSESTGLAESWVWQTNGMPWQLFTKLGNQPSPVLSGLGTQTATLSGTDSAVLEAAYLLTTQNPTQLWLTTDTTNTAGGREAITVGFATTRVRVQKNIAGRADSADQFTINIGGTPSDTATTTGATSGLQLPIADVFAIPATTYSINEAMTPGSVSPLSTYTQMVSAANTTPAGSVPPIDSLPINFTPALGDDVTYTILNIAPEKFTKTVNRAYADLGEILTYTVEVNNPNNVAYADVLVIDPTPVGTTFVSGSLVVVGSAYTGTNPNSGVTLTSIPANAIATLTWNVQVNSLPPISNPVNNVAMVMIPGGTSGPTNAVSTQINTAYVTVNKVTDKTFANVGDAITYTITVTNSGNVTANNVVLADTPPAGTTFVTGSLTNATGTPPTLTLNAPVPAGGSVVVTYQVLVGTVVPNPNPVKNSASAAFTYTVDPAQPNGATDTSYSNTVETQVNTAKLVTTKSVDKLVAYLGDTITYQIAMTNTGNTPANNVVITDPIPVGTALVPGSRTVSVPYTLLPGGAIALNVSLTPGQTVTVSFKVLVTAIPNPNPIVNVADITYTYTVDPTQPNAESATTVTNAVSTTVFRNNYGQQISDLIESVALEQAALAAIANAEGAKIQRMAAMPGITPQQLLCLNKSVADMMDSLVLLEAVLKQKLGIVTCQIDGETC